MTRCPECQRRVSDQAQACPECAYPLRRSAGPAGAAGVQTIEKTSKELKAQVLWAAFTVGFGMLLLTIAGGTESDAKILFILGGLLVSAIGVAWLLLVKYWIWWNHE